ncbi:MAG TPA: hypothetical protein VGX68_01070 [Thermoanaerobaculia bacterium]|jgi:hypothetical protein|nr:hypothetical protein [Thermoanaerobaculia bacterium]
MKDRTHWILSAVALVLALLLGLPGPAAAAETTAEPASPAREAAAPAASQDVTVVDMADAVIPNANHYKCYPILSFSEFIPRRVFLRDQFWSTWVWVWRPHYLCNPVWKMTEDGVVYEPPQPDAHLVCYDIREELPTPDWAVRTYDQFGWLTLKGNAAELLCLPAAKYVITPPGGGG